MIIDRHVKLLIANIYRSTRLTETKNKNLLTFLEIVFINVHKILILGDFNASEINWTLESAPENSFGQLLLKFLWKQNLIQHTDQNTRKKNWTRLQIFWI